MRLLVLFAVSAACALPGEWPHTRDADWVVRVLQRARFHTHGCTGSAFTVDLGRNQDLSMWAFSAPHLAVEPRTRVRRVAGVPVYLNRHRGVWRVRHRNVWIQAGPTTQRMPPVARWLRIVAATLVTPG